MKRDACFHLSLWRQRGRCLTRWIFVQSSILASFIPEALDCNKNCRNYFALGDLTVTRKPGEQAYEKKWSCPGTDSLRCTLINDPAQSFSNLLVFGRPILTYFLDRSLYTFSDFFGMSPSIFPGHLCRRFLWYSHPRRHTQNSGHPLWHWFIFWRFLWLSIFVCFISHACTYITSTGSKNVFWRFLPKGFGFLFFFVFLCWLNRKGVWCLDLSVGTHNLGLSYPSPVGLNSDGSIWCVSLEQRKPSKEAEVELNMPPKS